MPKTLATATVDRLLHHAHVCQTTGDSVRLTQALAGKGVEECEAAVTPLPQRLRHAGTQAQTAAAQVRLDVEGRHLDNQRVARATTPSAACTP